MSPTGSSPSPRPESARRNAPRPKSAGTTYVRNATTASSAEQGHEAVKRPQSARTHARSHPEQGHEAVKRPLSARTPARSRPEQGHEAVKRPLSARTPARSRPEQGHEAVKRPLSARTHVRWTPERRLCTDGFTDNDQLPPRNISARGEKLAPYRVHEPSCLSQHMAQASYEHYKLNEEAYEGSRTSAFAKQASRGSFSPPAILGLLPSSWRPTAEEVAEEARVSRCTKAQAAASLIAGREYVDALTRTKHKSPELVDLAARLQQGHLDVKAWVRWLNSAAVPSRSRARVTEASERCKSLPLPEKVLAALALLSNVKQVHSVDLSSLGLEKVPGALRAYQGVRSVDLSFNRPLKSLTDLPTSLEAVDLAGCQSLTDVRPLGTLPMLKAADLSCCESLGDVTPMLAGLLSPIATRGPNIVDGRSAKDEQAAKEEQDECHVRAKPQTSGSQSERPSCGRLSLQEVAALGHPSLNWLCLSGCVKLQDGVELLSSCQALSFVDLFDCSLVKPEECFAASLAVHIQHLVWPSISMLGEYAEREALPTPRLEKMLDKAAMAVFLKQELAAKRQRSECLGEMSKATAAATVSAAERAFEDLEVPRSRDALAVSETPIFAEVALQASQVRDDESCRKNTGTGMVGRGQISSCIGPVALSCGLKAASFKPKGGLQYCALFKLLDADKDGWISKEDFNVLTKSAVPVEKMTDAIGAALGRHNGACDITAFDFAGNRSKIDRSRIVECLVIAGVDAQLASIVAEAVDFCSQGVLPAFSDREDAVKAALKHGLSCFVIAYEASVVEDFRDFLKEKFEASKQAFAALDANGNGSISMEEFRLVVAETLQWPKAAAPAALEVVFRVLDRSATHKLEVQDFDALDAFSADRTLQAMASVGRALHKFPRERPTRLLKMNLDASVLLDQGTGMSRRTFATCWQDMGSRNFGVDGKMVFGLLDLDYQNRIYREQMLVLSDAMLRRAEIVALAELSTFLKTKFESLEAAFASLVTALTVQREAHKSGHKAAGKPKR
eukprot:TRINITY_DN24504_c0_g1_i1.p1 TRINITY_DN24504_c0_g1~~TRINITY_DN24504_c0_g1_i1.p1  ORF type:complete len:1056 (-),score=164.43 TRINITY_DN24504_c0_g1_i1:96-3146(-)